MNEKENSLRTIFIEAVEIEDAAERAAYLQRKCGDDSVFRQRMERLIRAHADAGGFTSAEPGTQLIGSVAEKPGDRIGRYKLREHIGEGGCGVVYVAEQEEPVRRRVALKIIKLGMDTRQVVARFEAERQALALMDHPNIAKVLDAGATETGRPYFVMELVRGIRITEYCDQTKLSIRDRLDLFIKVCHAIQHAHQKGIIHRDIKPSNILVTLHDGTPVPKVIDFGIAKATEGRLTDLTVYTGLNQFIGTPAYMSPEQAEMSGLDIDTRSDIYSLGVLLYELLTGKTPFDAKELLAVGLDEMRRTIREVEPTKPSTRLTQDRLATRSIGPANAAIQYPQSEIDKDLDWIVMKCLEKDRARRYETANGLATDLRRHLDNEPVVARPPTPLYQFQKLVRRNKLAFAAAGAVAAALIIGLGFSTWLFLRERMAAKIAKDNAARAGTEAAKATAIADFLQALLRSANPDDLKGSDYSVRQLLDDFSAGLTNQLGGQPEVEAAVRATIGRAYFRLGVADNAQAQHERALALRRRLYGNQDLQVAQSLVDYAWACFEQSEFVRAEPYAREAMAIYRAHGTAGQPVLSAMWVTQKIFSSQQRYAEVDAITAEALAAAGKSPGVEFPELASILHGQAEAKAAESKYAEAEALALRAVAMHRRVRRAGDFETAWGLLALGNAFKGRQKLVEAEGAYQEALAIFRKYYSSGHKSVDFAETALKSVLEAKGDSAAVEALARRRFVDANRRIEQNDTDAEAWIERALGQADAKRWKAAVADCAEAIARSKEMSATKKTAVGAGCLEVAERAFNAGEYEASESIRQLATGVFRQLVEENPGVAEHPRRLGQGLLRIGQALKDAGRAGQAEGVNREAMEVFKKAARDFPAETYFREQFALSGRYVADSLIGYGRFGEAIGLFRATADMYATLVTEAPENPFYRREEAYTAWSLAEALKSAGPSAAAEFRRALALYEQAIAKFPNDVTARFQFAELLRRQDRFAEAETQRREELAMRRKLVGEERPEVANSLHELANVLRDEGKLAESEATHREALALRRKLLGDEHRDVAASFDGLGILLAKSGRFVEAEEMFRSELAIQRKTPGNGHPDVANTLRKLGDVLRNANRRNEAEAMFREEVALRRKLGNEDLELGHSLHNLAWAVNQNGKPAEAEAFSREELALRRKLLGNEHVELSVTLNDLSVYLRNQHKLPEAEIAAREALAIRRRQSGNEDLNLGHSLHNLAWVLNQNGKPAEAEAFSREELALRRKLLGNEHVELSVTLNDLSVYLRNQHKLPEAEIAAREALAIRRKQSGNEDLNLGHSLHNLAWVLNQNGKPAEAEAFSREELAMRRKLLGNDHPELAFTLEDLSLYLSNQGKFPEAEAMQREAMAIRTKHSGKEHPDLRHMYHALADRLRDQRKFEEAEAAVREELALTRRLGNEHQDVSHALQHLADVLARRGKYAEYKTLYREAAAHADAMGLNALAWSLATDPDPALRDGPAAVDYAEKAVASTGRKNPMILDTLAAAFAEEGRFTNAIRVQREAIALLQNDEQKKDYAARLKLFESNSAYRDHAQLAELTRALLEEGKSVQAEPLARECLTLREKLIPDDWRAFNARALLGRALLGQKKYAEAEPLLLAGYEGMKKREALISAAGKPRLTEAIQGLVQLYEATGRPDRAAEWKQLAVPPK